MAETLNTQVLIQRVQRNDPEALNQLCERYLMRVLAAVRMRLGAKLRRKLESGDIVQAVMMDVLKKVKTFDFRTEGAFLKYLNRVVENKIRDEADHWAAQKRHQDLEVSLERRSPLTTIRLEIPEGNRPLEDWGKLIGDVPAATAILDRFLQDAELIQITGRSYRLRGKESEAEKPAERAPGPRRQNRFFRHGWAKECVDQRYEKTPDPQRSQALT